jgi:hypothetical protein
MSTDYCHFCFGDLDQVYSTYTCLCDGIYGVYKIHWSCDRKRKTKYNEPNCCDCNEKISLLNDGIKYDQITNSMVHLLLLLLTYNGLAYLKGGDCSDDSDFSKLRCRILYYSITCMLVIMAACIAKAVHYTISVLSSLIVYFIL